LRANDRTGTVGAESGGSTTLRRGSLASARTFEFGNSTRSVQRTTRQSSSSGSGLNGRFRLSNGVSVTFSFGQNGSVTRNGTAVVGATGAVFTHGDLADTIATIRQGVHTLIVAKNRSGGDSSLSLGSGDRAGGSRSG